MYIVYIVYIYLYILSNQVKFFNILYRHVNTVHEGLAKLECSFAQCNVTYKKLWDIMEKVIRNKCWNKVLNY